MLAEETPLLPTMPYRFTAFEPGIFVEVYLPKRARYQGTLYETLTDAFDFEHVRAHFRDPNKRDLILLMLAEFTEFYDPAIIDTVDQFFWGYSLYEVDGVFFSGNGRGAIEERTQVIRMMFFPDLNVAKQLVSAAIVERHATTLRRLVARTLRHGDRARAEFAAEIPDLLNYLDRWIGAVGLFLFGYFVFNLCERIRSIDPEGGTHIEEELWVSSFWNLEVNKVTLQR